MTKVKTKIEAGKISMMIGLHSDRSSVLCIELPEGTPLRVKRPTFRADEEHWQVGILEYRKVYSSVEPGLRYGKPLSSWSWLMSDDVVEVVWERPRKKTKRYRTEIRAGVQA